MKSVRRIQRGMLIEKLKLMVIESRIEKLITNFVLTGIEGITVAA